MNFWVNILHIHFCFFLFYPFSASQKTLCFSFIIVYQKSNSSNKSIDNCATVEWRIHYNPHRLKFVSQHLTLPPLFHRVSLRLPVSLFMCVMFDWDFVIWVRLSPASLNVFIILLYSLLLIVLRVTPPCLFNHCDKFPSMLRCSF